MEKINFINNQAPAINETNLNQLQTNVENAINEAKPKVTENRVLVSNSDGFVSASEITDTELNYLDGATGNIQNQINQNKTELNNKQATINSGTSLPSKVTNGTIFLLYS